MILRRGVCLMWPFSSSHDDVDSEQFDEERNRLRRCDTEELRLETQELQAKLEALRMAEYREDERREEQRSSCAAPPAQRTAQPTPADAPAGNAAEADSSAGAVVYSMADEAEHELNAMYDFDRFVSPSAPTSADAASASCSRPAPEQASPDRSSFLEVQRLRAREAELHKSIAALEEQTESQEKKLTAASRAVQKTRSQVKQLTAQLGLKELHGSKLNVQVEELRGMLVEREQELQDALDDADAAIGYVAPLEAAPLEAPKTEACDTMDKVSMASGADGGLPPEAQQPQEGDDEAKSSSSGACSGPTSQSVERQPSANEEQALQLMRITEELTDALEATKEGEETARRHLIQTTAQIQEEEARRAHCLSQTAEIRRAHDTQVAELLRRLATVEQDLAAEHMRSSELEGLIPRDSPSTTSAGASATKSARQPPAKPVQSPAVDPEVAAAEAAALAAIEAQKRHGQRSAAKVAEAAALAVRHHPSKRAERRASAGLPPAASPRQPAASPRAVAPAAPQQAAPSAAPAPIAPLVVPQQAAPYAMVAEPSPGHMACSAVPAPQAIPPHAVPPHAAPYAMLAEPAPHHIACSMVPAAQEPQSTAAPQAPGRQSNWLQAPIEI